MKSKQPSIEREETSKLARQLLEEAIEGKISCVLIVGDETHDSFKMLGVNAHIMEVYELVDSALEKINGVIKNEMREDRTLN